ncbi:uncharacterized protein N7529_010805 [Penicillium soppii]|uniref:uncharacterized protein n=1 Tax=Penicillium soppii TaxID=69789 RepID=UPI002549AF75|nr:uncharacterized protein N7529_010805 [Penicillium soppii]KAJ5851420.1 hypothetical protein N7529_010805 [Penicillium soppii]
MVDGWKRHTHPFSIPEHGSKTGNISDIRTKDEPEGSNRGKENIKKSMYTKENKGKNRGGRKAQFEGINPGEYRRKSKDKNNLLPVVAMPSQENNRKSHILQQFIPSETLFGRIASMQDLYIGRTSTTADRSSSRANLTAASAPSSPATAAN